MTPASSPGLSETLVVKSQMRAPAPTSRLCRGSSSTRNMPSKVPTELVTRECPPCQSRLRVFEILRERRVEEVADHGEAAIARLACDHGRQGRRGR